MTSHSKLFIDLFKRCYAALLRRRGPHIASHSVCLSVRLSVRPVLAYLQKSVTCFRPTLRTCGIFCFVYICGPHAVGRSAAQTCFSALVGRLNTAQRSIACDHCTVTTARWRHLDTCENCFSRFLEFNYNTGRNSKLSNLLLYWQHVWYMLCIIHSRVVIVLCVLLTL